MKVKQIIDAIVAVYDFDYEIRREKQERVKHIEREKIEKSGNFKLEES